MQYLVEIGGAYDHIIINSFMLFLLAKISVLNWLFAKFKYFFFLYIYRLFGEKNLT